MTERSLPQSKDKPLSVQPVLQHRLLLALALLLIVVTVGTCGFVWLEGRSFLDALYMTLVTISTLGMTAQDTAPVTQAGQIWIMLLIVVGIVSAMVALSLMVSTIVEGQVRRILGRRQVNRKIQSLHNHIIVCGYGGKGTAVCDNLKRRNAPIVIIDSDDTRTAQAEVDGLLYVLGNATQEATLMAAGVQKAQALVANLANDGDNVLVTLVARELSQDIFIAATVAKTESEPHLRRAGADSVICPELISAKRLANILTRPGVVDFIDFAAEGLQLEAEQYRIKADNKLVGQSLKEANLPRSAGILIIALRRADGETIFNPSADTVFQPDDTMIITGRIGSMAKLEQNYA
ncbi:MAG: potassium channel protein [Sedimentisphaerales bacterium]|nr:potassium channel protein [Sedimentisphaerales bacterium]